jgi:subtilase family serine protease
LLKGKHMIRSNLFPRTLVVLLIASGCSGGSVTDESAAEEAALSAIQPRPSQALCGGAGHRFHCKSRLRPDVRGFQPEAAGALGAADLVSAYQLDTSRSPGAIVAIVDAFGYANAESDLAVYRSKYGLPPCTVASGCLTIVNQNGQTSPLPPDPPANDDWTGETALDLDMASAGCPNCKILLVQADDDQGDGLMIAQETAAKLGAAVISNSWGGPEDPNNPATNSEHYFKLTTSASIFVAAGDDGYDDAGQGPDYPSTSAYAIGVGGTSLTRSATTRGWSEKAWSSGGSSCSLSIAKPSYQGSTSCSFRASADIAAVGDPATGVAVYNQGSWQVVGGTSAASPLAAAIYALTGNASAGASLAYAHTSAFYDITTGTNGQCGNILCRAGTGWDGPTGVGTPNGSALAQLGTGSPVDMGTPPDMSQGPGSGNNGNGSGNGNGNGSGSGSGNGNTGGTGGVGGGPTTGTGGGSTMGNGCSIGGTSSGDALGLILLAVVLGLLVRARNADRRRAGGRAA